jgi:predicted nucleic acid-binding protein
MIKQLEMLLDSNIVIYAVQPRFVSLQQFLAARPSVVSAITKVEVLGFHRITPEDKASFEAFFSATRVLPVDSGIVARAVVLRQVRKMSLGDAIVAATAIEHDLTVVTRNVSDFQWVPGLRVLNPIDEPT